MSSTYFITGATGAVGADLVHKLLELPGVRLKLLVRARDREHLQQRLKDLYVFWGRDHQADQERIIPLQGDMQQPGFGLDRDEYQQLSRECTHIIHCAGNVRMNLSLEEARRSSLTSAQSIIQLARDSQEQGKLEKVEFVSTVGVGGKLPGTVPERFITEEREFHNTYEQAKAEAEDYIQPYVEQGMPITVHRPSMVVGDSRSGRILHFQVFYHICEFLSGRRTKGVLPDLSGALLDIVPVDYVARALVCSSQEQNTAGHILHLCSGPDKALDLMQLGLKVRDVFTAAGIDLPRDRIVPLRLFRAFLSVISVFAPQKTKRALRALPVFLEYLKQRQVFAVENSQEILKAYGIEPWDQELVQRVLNFYLQHRSMQK